MARNPAFRDISRNAMSTASVLLSQPCAAMTFAKSASSMCIVIFMPYSVWYDAHAWKSFSLKSTSLSSQPLAPQDA